MTSVTQHFSIQLLRQISDTLAQLRAEAPANPGGLPITRFDPRRETDLLALEGNQG